MSKKGNIKIGENGMQVYGFTYKSLRYVEGRIRTIIEAVGLPEKQHKSLTDLIIGELYNMWDKPEFTYVEDDDGYGVQTQIG